MKLTLVAVLSFLFCLIGGHEALAVGSGAAFVRRVLPTSPVGIYNYVELVASTSKGIKGVQINNMGPSDIKLAFGASGSEVDQIIVGGLQDTAFLPLAGGYASRISVIALDGPSETGELDMNLFYN